MQAGTYDRFDNWVLGGCLKAFYTDQEGKDHILQFAAEDWWIADYQAYFNQTPATINIDCMEDCQLLQLSVHKREKICSEMHKMEHFFRKKSNQRLHCFATTHPVFIDP
ncbi:hypothetical protein [Persicobacter diffluens]|uniref:Uncharacterized protein n=1 Tax=Persicobacter diffluens TaxID=981 RepID=A0AAN4W4R4_9BACT|nr:hypothetical protein PEDI_56740 [Persicobacter diffluens]